MEYSRFALPGCSGMQHPSNLHTAVNICVCCLLKDGPFVKLSKCKHVEFFEYYFKFKLEYPETLVCYRCHRMLQEIYEFKKQVESSLMRLNDQLYILQPNNIKLSKLTQSNIETGFIGNIEPVDIEIMTPEIKRETVEIEIDVPLSSFGHHENSELSKEVVSYEFGSKTYEINKCKYNDRLQETEVPLSSFGHHENSELSKEVVSYEFGSKTYEINKYKYNDPLQNYEGKVRTVVLSEAELKEERKRDAEKERYLKLPFKCESCITGFDRKETLQDHMEKRHNEEHGGHSCEICKSVQKTVEGLRLHLKCHYKRYECVPCGLRYTHWRSALDHYGRLHGALPRHLQCRECDYTAQSYRDYVYHADKHKEKPSCADCGASFVNKQAVKNHIMKVHQMSHRMHRCDQCDKEYKSRAGLLSHVASVHRGDTGAGAYCAQCNKHFRTEKSLKHHLNTHSRHVSDDDKKFECIECSDRFLTKSQLREHVDWEHLKSTNHQCTLCHKTFKNSRNLKCHMRFIHEKKRRPKDKMCDHCGQGFTTTTTLRTHVRTHTGERPLSCAHCAATFAHPAALYTHNKLKHTQKE